MDDLVQKYREKLNAELGVNVPEMDKTIISKEYKQFKLESKSTHMNFYEKACNFSEKIFTIKPDSKKAIALDEAIKTSHLNVTPGGVSALAIIIPLIVILFGGAFSILISSTFFGLFFLLAGVSLLFVFNKIPFYYATNWRMKASNQMVLCIFYIVTYMRHTSNLELAIEFASQHLSPPLSLDLRRILWDVETSKYDTIRDSLDEYLENWRQHSSEFVEAFHLIEGSLLEGDEKRRLQMLDKSLDVILEGTFEKMLHYAHNLKSPITTLHMLGVILPVLGLVILPLMVSFMDGVKWYNIAMLYNVLLPVVVYYMGMNILATRPTGYGDTDIAELNPELKKFRKTLFKIGSKEISISPAWTAVAIGGVLLFIALLPPLIHLVNPSFDIAIGETFKLLDYKESITTPGLIIGPYGMGASLLSLFFPLSLGLGIGLYFRNKSKNVMAIRDKTKKLETEFASALFQLGNRLGDGLPAEIAVGKVAQVMEGTVSGSFFQLVSSNISKLGLGLKDAIFKPKVGAINFFPSKVIDSSMKVLIQSVQKGPEIAAQALTNVSRYIKEIHRVNERLTDLMADIVADMKSQIHFLAPTISGIVIGITSMITTILGSLSSKVTEVGSGGASRISTISDLFGDGIPTYYFQMVVGIYVVQIIFVLTVLANGIENGADKLNERYTLGRNLIKSTLTYLFVAFTVMVLFNVIASKILVSTIS